MVVKFNGRAYSGRMLLGHIAIPAIIRHYWPHARPIPLYTSSVFADVADKSLHLMGLRGNGRTYFHSLLGLGATTAAVRLVWGGSAAKSWLVGYTGHLISDTGGTVPWLYPFVQYRFYRSPYTLGQKIKRAFTKPKAADLLFLLWAVGLTVWRFRHGR